MAQSFTNPFQDPVRLRDAIRQRAEQLFEKSGRVPGHDLENWCEAEAQIMRECAGRFERKAIVVNVSGVVYTGEYDPDAADGYAPGEWQQGDPVRVRIADEKMYLRRLNGKVLETAIVKKIG